MNDEVREWLAYARENLQTAEICLDRGLLHAPIQNAQQAVEKSLKALCLHLHLPLRKSHSTGMLARDLESAGAQPLVSAEECELLDSVYLPSKYPLAGVAPPFTPTLDLAAQCLDIARRVFRKVEAALD